MRNSRIAIAALAALSIVAASCGSDDDNTATTTAPPASAAPTDTTATGDSTAPPETAAPGGSLALDTNGDGKVRFGIAAAGPRDDGGYYQALVDKATEISAEEGFEDPIVVDNITTENAATELANLAQQGVDAILVGASEIADPLSDLIEQYPEIFWYCNCGAGYPSNPGLAQSQDDSSEISYTAGYATGLLLKDSGGDSAAFIGCCDLNFEKEAYLAYEMGLKAVDPSYTMTYIPTGNFPFDFDNTAGATEALNGAITNGADAVYPYLGGALQPVVKLANEKNVITMSAGSSKACASTDLSYQIQVRFDGGDYLGTILNEIVDGKFNEGDTRVFRVGVDPEPGAQICDPTPDQQAAMDEVYAQIAAGDFAADFGAIKGQAYSGG
jgi:basic membrane protein A and related proteins